MSEILFQILSRVRTFTVSNWIYSQSDELDPYNLASIGYYVKQPLVLQCCVCHHQIIFSQQLEANAQTLKQQIKSHKSNCIYLGQQALKHNKKALYLMMDEITQSLKTSHALLEESKKYPLLNQQQIQQQLVNQSFTMKAINEGYKFKKQTIRITFFLALFGWTAVKINDKIHIECLFCGRKSGQGQLKFKSENQQIESESQSSNGFDPVNNHRYFCLWSNKKIQGFAGWQLCLQYLYDKMIESKSLFSKRLPQQTKKIRVQLDKYLQTFQNQTGEQFNKVKNIFQECQKMKKVIESQSHTINTFQNTQKRMNQFVDDDIGVEFKDKVKKIKLN